MHSSLSGKERRYGMPAAIVVTGISTGLFDMIGVYEDRVFCYGHGLDLAQVMEQLQAMPSALGSFTFIWAPQEVRDMLVVSKVPNSCVRPREEIVRRFGAVAPVIDAQVLAAAVPWQFASQVCGSRARPEIKDWLLPELLQRTRDLERATNIISAESATPDICVMAIEIPPFIPRQVIGVQTEELESFVMGLRNGDPERPTESATASRYVICNLGDQVDLIKQRHAHSKATVTIDDWTLNPLTTYSCTLPFPVPPKYITTFIEARETIMRAKTRDPVVLPWYTAPDFTHARRAPDSDGHAPRVTNLPIPTSRPRLRRVRPPSEERSSSLTISDSEEPPSSETDADEESSDPSGRVFDSDDSYDDDEEDADAIVEYDSEEEAESHSVHSDDLTSDESSEPKAKKKTVAPAAAPGLKRKKVPLTLVKEPATKKSVPKKAPPAVPAPIVADKVDSPPSDDIPIVVDEDESLECEGA